MADAKEEKQVTSPFMQSLLEAQQAKFGKDGVFVGTDQDKYLVGPELQPLALQWLITLNILPLQSIITFAAPEKNYKTSALLELERLVMTNPVYPGEGLIFETESKWSPSKARSLLGAVTDRLPVIPAHSVQDWQSKAGAAIKGIQEFAAKVKAARHGKNKEYKGLVIPPTIIGIDSANGVESESIQDKVMADGFVGKHFPDRAGLNTSWLQTIPGEIRGIPVTVVMVQHLKDPIDATASFGGLSSKVAAGGKCFGFQTSLEIRCQKVGKIDKAAYGGHKLKWKVHHNSLGRDGRDIIIPYIETWDAQDNELAYFDWDAALTLLIMDFKEQPRWRERVEAVTGKIVESTKTGFGKVYSCPKLGIASKDAAEREIDETTLGKMLQADPEIRADLQKALRIQIYPIWSPETEL